MGFLKTLFAPSPALQKQKEEFDKEKNAYLEEIRKHDDHQILLDFHKYYAPDRGRGLIRHTISSAFSLTSDPKYSAYTEIFEERRFRMLHLTCPSCGYNSLGYRMYKENSPVSDEIYNDPDIVEGNPYRPTWRCECGREGSWRIVESPVHGDSEQTFASIKAIYF